MKEFERDEIIGFTHSLYKGKPIYKQHTQIGTYSPDGFFKLGVFAMSFGNVAVDDCLPIEGGIWNGNVPRGHRIEPQRTAFIATLKRIDV